MRIRVVAAVLAVAVSAGCRSKESTVDQERPAPAPPPPAVAKAEPPRTPAAAPLEDITAQSSLKAVRAVFNAHKGEARFLTLLSPT